MEQQKLFSELLNIYSNGATSNADMYKMLNEKSAANDDESIFPVGSAKAPRNTAHRRYRWAQQTLKCKGLIQRHSRGRWGLTQEGKYTLTRTLANNHMVAFSTKLGVALWGDSEVVFRDVIKDTVHLCLTSIPYLGITRSYKKSDLSARYDELERLKQEHIDFLLRIFEPICHRLAPGGSLAINLSNDTVVPGRGGERSDFLEDFTFALRKKLGLKLMDRIVWHAPDKPPRGYHVTHKRTHLTPKYEPILWLTNDETRLLADNRRVLSPYSDDMQNLIAKGGESTSRNDADYITTRKGSFGRDNGGSIPGNVLTIPVYCKRNRNTQDIARRLKLPTHGALFPFALADKLVPWLCPPDGVVVDPFGGYLGVGEAAEAHGRSWYASELHWEYLKPAIANFTHCDSFTINPKFDALSDESLRVSLAS
ncbi:hypothetical protein BM525_20050 (plasmid) [Alteromonas mediterranea]|uniref:Methyltransferase n=1 Tax=Alteromonas mediterranea TaxID=314275 RepID=A0AAC9NU59_9ALTE|nr:site-specific DNA-methyltransferase [Alteromonas mediterranea]APD92177.1 hypothetical protein BM524_19855 [Alteromonas mediterranea]APE00032.1 hypothetical protein BM525_20050 [Alteromonas mediterranea]